MFTYFLIFTAITMTIGYGIATYYGYIAIRGKPFKTIFQKWEQSDYYYFAAWLTTAGTLIMTFNNFNYIFVVTQLTLTTGEHISWYVGHYSNILGAILFHKGLDK